MSAMSPTLPSHSRGAPALPTVLDLRPDTDDLRGDVIRGLSSTPKRLLSKYLYDARGSELFEKITCLPEYDLTRVELELLHAVMPQVRDAVGVDAHVVEYGSGSGRKTHLLLAGLESPVAYTAVEISRQALLDATLRLSTAFPDVQMLPVCADFTHAVELPQSLLPAESTLLFFPGSTLGNFETGAAVDLLQAMRETMGTRGRALIGLDLVKDVADMERAYNDAAGITAEFTLNLLARINRELGADFELRAFEHRARWDAARSHIATSIVSRRPQVVRVEGHAFHFMHGEEMQVETSHKYTDADFDALAAAAGLRVVKRWNSPGDRFGLRLLENA